MLEGVAEEVAGREARAGGEGVEGAVFEEGAEGEIGAAIGVEEDGGGGAGGEGGSGFGVRSRLRRGSGALAPKGATLATKVARSTCAAAETNPESCRMRIRTRVRKVATGIEKRVPRVTPMAAKRARRR